MRKARNMILRFRLIKSMKAPSFQRLVHPPPMPLVKEGRMIRQNTRREMITEGELMSQLHQQGVEDLAEVKAAYLEGDGNISIILHEPAKQEVNNIFREEVEGEQYRGILGISEDPLVSSDIIKESRASIIDLSLTQVVDGNLVKVMSWYDNEWGYTNQMIRQALELVKD